MNVSVPAINNNEVTYKEALNYKPGTMFIFVDKKGIIYELEKKDNDITYLDTKRSFDPSIIGNEPELIITDYTNNQELWD